MSNGMCIALIVAGAVLRFALTARFPHGLNVHVVGVILILAGVLGLILSFLTGLPRDRRRRPTPPDHRPAYVPTPDAESRLGYDVPAPAPDNRHLVRPGPASQAPGPRETLTADLSRPRRSGS